MKSVISALSSEFFLQSVQEFDSIEPYYGEEEGEFGGQILPEDPSLSMDPDTTTDGSLTITSVDASQEDGDPTGGIKPFGCAVPGCNYRAYTSHNMQVR